MISQKKKKEGKTSGEAMFVFTGINTWKQHYRRSTVVIIIIGSRNNDLSGDIRYARYNLWDDIAYSNFRVERINKSARVIPTRKSASKRKGMARVRKREREREGEGRIRCVSFVCRLMRFTRFRETWLILTRQMEIDVWVASSIIWINTIGNYKSTIINVISSPTSPTYI